MALPSELGSQPAATVLQLSSSEDSATASSSAEIRVAVLQPPQNNLVTTSELLFWWNSSSGFPSAPACINPLDGEFAASETPAPIHALPITMKAPLFLYILFALLDLGACLQCEVCTGFGRDCMGSMETCSSGEDSCAITVFESLIGR
ncbi:hypothetical protein UY3_15838 [Chelonia mydas]|uniref:Phospholipase A2 inhibitor N-terminal domain-containing protein n=1 Tax=Chelonia mydas TaxID=8469 RepID=M7B4K9_CHEMY|nr:hypothetical protein UY3_15838 [Chelonia mydas]